MFNSGQISQLAGVAKDRNRHRAVEVAGGLVLVALARASETVTPRVRQSLIEESADYLYEAVIGRNPDESPREAAERAMSEQVRALQERFPPADAIQPS